MRTLGFDLPRIIGVLALAVGVAGCSAIKLGYSTFPNLAYFWLDGYVDFSDSQAPLARGELERLHAWHRQEELPRLVDLLARLEQMAPGPVSPQQACGVVREVQARLNLVADRAEPAVTTLATDLSAKQLKHLERKYRSNNSTFRKDWLEQSPAEQKEKRYEQMLDRIEMIYGRLDDPQRAVLRRGIEQSIHDPQRILAERQRRQQDLLATLQQVTQPATPAAESRALLRAYLQRAQHSPDAGYRAWQEALLEEGCRIFSAVHDSTTPAQRDQAVRRLRAYQRDLRDLAGQR